MPRFDLIARKLGAIKDKNVNEIVAERVYLPISNTLISKTKNERIGEVSKWLARRVDVLETAQSMTDSKINITIQKLYQGLTRSNKEMLDSSTDNEARELFASNPDYESLCAMHLYNFSLGLNG